MDTCIVCYAERKRGEAFAELLVKAKELGHSPNQLIPAMEACARKAPMAAKYWDP